MMVPGSKKGVMDLQEIIRVIKTKEHNIMGIFQVQEVMIVRYFRTASESTRYFRNNKVKRIVAYTRNY